MTTFDATPSIEDLRKEVRLSLPPRKFPARVPGMPLVHIGLIVLVAVFCMNLVH